MRSSNSKKTESIIYIIEKGLETKNKENYKKKVDSLDKKTGFKS